MPKNLEQKQEEAAQRREMARTAVEQLAHLDKMGFAAKKERVKLAALIASSKSV